MFRNNTNNLQNFCETIIVCAEIMQII